MSRRPTRVCKVCGETKDLEFFRKETGQYLMTCMPCYRLGLKLKA